MLDDEAQHEDSTKRFFREAKVAGAIDSPHVARLLDLGRLDTGAPFMVLELLEGEALDVVIRDELGIMHASSGKLAGKQIRRWRQRVESRLGSPPVEVPLEWARHRIAAARERNDTSGQLLPLGLDSCAPLFQPIPDSEPEHPEGTAPDATDADAAEPPQTAEGGEV